MPDLIRAITPLFLGGLGATIAIFAMLTPLSNDKLSLVLGISSSAITGAAGLAQSSNTKLD
jgi:hypothetical protein